MSEKLPESLLDLALKWNIRGAELNDVYQARHVHTILNRMLTEVEIHKPQWGLEGHYWLTQYGKTVLADMHDGLSLSPDQGDRLVSSVLETVMLAPTRGDMRNFGDIKRELEIRAAVVIEKENRNNKDKPISVNQACKNVAESGEYGLKWLSIRNIYYKTSKGFDDLRQGEFLPPHYEKQVLESGITNALTLMKITLL